MFRTGHKAEPSPVESPEPQRAEPEPAPPAAAAAAAPITPAPASGPRRDATLGRGVSFNGTLRFTGLLVLEGTFQGHILSGDTLVISDGAKVHADVTCGAIEVSGEAEGSLTATRAVELRGSARVSANVTTPSLRVAEGALLDGTVRMKGGPSASRTVRIERAKRPAHAPDVAEEHEAPEETVPTG